MNEFSFDFKSNKTLLIAEDDDLNFMLLEEFFKDQDIIIVRALNGIEALELCKSKQHFDLVLMDIKMPKMDGYETTRRIKECKPELPVIALTAYSTDTDKKKALASGCSDFVSKPINKNLLLSKINHQLQE